MNAYELADILQEYYDDFDGSFPALEKSIVMLRQQADRIAELEKETHSINYTCPNCETHVELFYKTPQIKELSDEEIIEIRDSCYVQSGIDEWEFDDVVFARAILKKASEK